MFNPKTIEEISKEIFQSLLEQNTQLSDISSGSVLSAVTRSFSGSLLNQELLLNSLAESFYLNTSKGTDLDLRAADYALTRKPGSFSTGSVLAISLIDTVTIPLNTILTEPFTGLQWTTETNSAPVNTTSESSIQIKSLAYGSDNNLLAGTKLITPLFPGVVFLVGTHRTTAREICGDLTGGKDIETDEQLRSRIINSIINSRGTTENALKSAVLTDQAVSWVSIKTPIPGFIQVWVDSPSLLLTPDIQRLEQIVNSVKPVGISFSVQQVTRLIQDINIFIRPASSANLQELSDKLIGSTQEYILQLRIGETFSRVALVKKLLNVPQVLDCNIINPLTDVQPNDSSVIRGGKILITYETA
jgi:hypothetical protein